MSVTSDSRSPEVLRTPLTAALIADYEERVAQSTVVRSVEAATQAVALFGEDPEAMPRIVERIARADLDQVAEGRNSGARIFGVRRSRRADDD